MPKAHHHLSKVDISGLMPEHITKRFMREDGKEYKRVFSLKRMVQNKDNFGVVLGPPCPTIYVVTVSYGCITPEYRIPIHISVHHTVKMSRNPKDKAISVGTTTFNGFIMLDPMKGYKVCKLDFWACSENNKESLELSPIEKSLHKELYRKLTIGDTVTLRSFFKANSRTIKFQKLKADGMPVEMAKAESEKEPISMKDGRVEMFNAHADTKLTATEGDRLIKYIARQCTNRIAKAGKNKEQTVPIASLVEV